MACPAIITGDAFVLRTIAHLDCQSRALGTFGYQSLAQPGSTASLAMSALLTIFVALYGIRLMFGPGPGLRDTLMDVVKIGVVLTLAFSWPAWKVLASDLVLDGPADIAASITTSELAPSSIDLPHRLQAVDTAIVQMTTLDTGRGNGALVEGGQLGGDFRGAALRDADSFGSARLFFLTGVIGSLALLRFSAGILLALAPLAAGLLLFGMTRGLFSGWLRGLVLALLGTLAVSMVLLLELAVLEPFLADALRVRRQGYATPAVPTELYAITLAFGLVLVGMVWIVGKIAFTRGWQDIAAWRSEAVTSDEVRVPLHGAGSAAATPPTRAARIVDSVETVLRREENAEMRRTGFRGMAAATSGGGGGDSGPGTSYGSSSGGEARLGSSYRRTTRRTSGAAGRRDGGTT